MNSIRYADDTLILADNITRLQTLMDHLAQHSYQFGLNVNVHKKNKWSLERTLLLVRTSMLTKPE